jgi:hypothetical protein
MVIQPYTYVAKDNMRRFRPVTHRFAGGDLQLRSTTRSAMPSCPYNSSIRACTPARAKSF